MTRPQFCKFKTDWDVCKHITILPDSQLHAHFYNSCNDFVPTSVVNSTSNFMTLSEDQLLTIIENIVTQQSNLAVHHLKFRSITQSDNEPINDFVIHLKSSAPDCEFTCPQYNYNLQDIHLKDQLIKGINKSHWKLISLPRPTISTHWMTSLNMQKPLRLPYVTNHHYNNNIIHT